MFIFKTAAAQVGTISTFRVYSGTLKPDSHVFNVQTKADERIGQIDYIQRGKMQENSDGDCSRRLWGSGKIRQYSYWAILWLAVKTSPRFIGTN